MAGFKRSVIINKAIEEVFDFATNLDNASKFLPGVTKIEMLTEGGMKPGAKFKETRKGAVPSSRSLSTSGPRSMRPAPA